MSVARSALLEPLEEFELPVDKMALVIGGGVAGMTSALSLAEQGFEVFSLRKNQNWEEWPEGFITHWKDWTFRHI